ncbi:polysaccharide pyruvyl transferase family protein [Muricoccus radiodurans]|uniref:polysaccharide pyruvyl transferase family protein n=1 Tax=Muricoccus radiodurans TaxID=2231721 RepID=UPI003CEA4358
MNDAPGAPGRPAGRVDRVTDQRIEGWLDAAVLGGGRVTLQILRDDEPCGTQVIAPATARAEPWGRVVPFALPLPGPAEPGSAYSVRVLNGRPLAGSARRPVAPSRPARALVMIPAGYVYEHDKVRLYNRILEGDYGNIGDLMVYESTLKLLDYVELQTLEIANPTDETIRRANEEFDFAFLRGSNFIHEYMDWERAPEVLERLKIPVVAVGVGAQSAERRRISLPPEARRVWHAIADRCAAVGTRGAWSAEVLADNGVRNVEVVGCPSLFRARDRNLRLRLPPRGGVRRAAFSLRRETGKGYARDLSSYAATQKAFMMRLNRECELHVTVHGEAEEKWFALHDEARIPAATEKLRQSGWLDPVNEAAMLDLYRNRSFFYQTGEEYDHFVRDMDITLGYRVHGVLPALANGIPSMLVNYDERSAELARTHRIPMLDEAALRGRGLDLYDPARFAEWQAAFPKGYDRMRDHLVRNGIPHRM